MPVRTGRVSSREAERETRVHGVDERGRRRASMAASPPAVGQVREVLVAQRAQVERGAVRRRSRRPARRRAAPASPRRPGSARTTSSSSRAGSTTSPGESRPSPAVAAAGRPPCRWRAARRRRRRRAAARRTAPVRRCASRRRVPLSAVRRRKRLCGEIQFHLRADYLLSVVVGAVELVHCGANARTRRGRRVLTGCAKAVHNAFMAAAPGPR